MSSKRSRRVNRYESVPLKWRCSKYGSWENTIGPLFGKIESHFRLKRPGTNTEVDANITALKMFFTIIADVLAYIFIFNHILLLMGWTLFLGTWHGFDGCFIWMASQFEVFGYLDEDNWKKVSSCKDALESCWGDEGYLSFLDQYPWVTTWEITRLILLFKFFYLDWIRMLTNYYVWKLWTLRFVTLIWDAKDFERLPNKSSTANVQWNTQNKKVVFFPRKSSLVYLKMLSVIWSLSMTSTRYFLITLLSLHTHLSCFIEFWT